MNNESITNNKSLDVHDVPQKQASAVFQATIPPLPEKHGRFVRCLSVIGACSVLAVLALSVCLVLGYYFFDLVCARAGLDQKEIDTLKSYLIGKAMQKPELPIQVTHRIALLPRSGRVATLKNTSDKPISLQAEFQSEHGKEKKAFQVSLGAKETKEIGWREGWALQYGHTIYLSADGYLPSVLRITEDGKAVL